MGVVYNSNYLIWFEIGRADLMRDLGHSYREIEEDGYLFPVAEATCRYKGSAAYDDEIVTHTSVLRLRRSLIRFGYRIFSLGFTGMIRMASLSSKGSRSGCIRISQAGDAAAFGLVRTNGRIA